MLIIAASISIDCYDKHRHNAQVFELERYLLTEHDHHQETDAKMIVCPFLPLFYHFSNIFVGCSPLLILTGRPWMTR